MFGLPPLPRTLNAALRDSEHERKDVRASALRDLARHAHGEQREQALSAMLRCLTADPDAEVRSEAALALADAGAREALSALLTAARQGELRVRQMAVLALGEVAPPEHEETRELLSVMHRAREPALRFQALIALHRLGGEAAQAAVLDALADDDAEIRAMGYRCAEERWATESPPETLQRSAERALNDDDARVQLGAALLLASLGDPKGGEVLLRVVDGTLRVGTEADHQAAIEQSAKLGLAGARRALSRRAFGPFGLRNDSLAWHARTALAKLGDERAKLSILRGLRAFLRDTRTLSVVAAGRAKLPEALPIISAMRGDEARADQDAVAEALEALSVEVAGI